MTDRDLRGAAHDLDVTLWVGKAGIAAVTDELDAQLGDHELVKAKFLRAARADGSVADLADRLADAVDADVIETRGNTVVFHR